MAFIKSKQGKKGVTYYIVYNQKVRKADGTETTKKKWLKVGKTKTEAQLALRQFEKERREKPGNFIAKETIHFHRFVTNEFLPWCKTRKTSSEFSRTGFEMGLMSNYFGSLQLNEITPRIIEDYISWRKERPTRGKRISNRTVNIDLIYLSQCFKQAIEWGFNDQNPCKKVKKLKENKNRVRFFSDEEIATLLGHSNPYIKRFLIVGLSTGMRLKEMLNLKLSSIDIPGNVIHIVNDDSFQTKNGRNRDIPISSYLSVHLQVYMKTWVHPRTFSVSGRTLAQSEFLFCNKQGGAIKSFKTAYKSLLKSAGIKNATIHTMRHTFASHLVMKGVGIRTVQELLGHSSIGVTEMYSHLSAGFKKQEIDLLDFGGRT